MRCLGRCGPGRLSMVIAGAVVATMGLAGPAAAQPRAEPVSGWAQFQGNAAHTGDEAGERSVNRGNVHQLSTAWTVAAPAGTSYTSEVAVTGGVVYAASGDIVTAYDAAGGTQLWQVSLPDDVKGTPAVQGGRVVVVYTVTVGRGAHRHAESFIEALDSTTGALVWTRMVGVLASSDSGGVTTTARRAYVILASNQVEAIGLSNGYKIWESPALPGCSLSQASASGRFVVIGEGGGGVAAINASDGTVAWQDSLGGGCGFTTNNWVPAISQGMVYAGLLDGVDAISLATGTVVWANDTVTSAFFGPSLTGNDVIISSDNTSQLFALSRSDGSIEWQTHLSNSVEITTSAIFGGLDWALVDNARAPSTVRAVALDAATGHTVFVSTHYGNVTQDFPPAVAADHVYVDTGTELVSLTVPGPA